MLDAAQAVIYLQMIYTCRGSPAMQPYNYFNQTVDKLVIPLLKLTVALLSIMAQP